MKQERLLELAGVQLNESRGEYEELVNTVAKYIVDDIQGSTGELHKDAVREELTQFQHSLKERLNQLAGLNEGEYEPQHAYDDDEAAEEALVKELGPLKKQLDEIMSRYPHAAYDDVLHWLKQ